MAAARPKLLGSETPRIFTPPLRELTPDTSLGFECIAFAESVLGVTLYPWQKWLLIHILELLPSGILRFRKVVVLVGRQNGKSTVGQVLALYFMAVLGAPRVLGTAQDLGTAEEIWQDTLDMARDAEDLAELITKPKLGLPIAATRISARRQWPLRSLVCEWHTVTVAPACMSSIAIGLPTMFERPTTTASLPLRLMPASSKNFIAP